MDGFTHGFDLGDDSVVSDTRPQNSQSVSLAPDQARKKINKEITAGRMAGPFKTPAFQPFHICPIGLRAKKTPGQYRLIHDLSYPYDDSTINSTIPDSDKSVNYATVHDAILKIQQLPTGSYAAKTDIENAFKLIPVKPALYPKLGIHFDNFYYYDKTLPQGCASSCRIFEIFSTALQWIIEKQVPNVKTVNYLDDFLFVASSKVECQKHLQAFLNICQCLGVPIAPEKTTSQNTTVTFLGIELDTVKHMARLPLEKIHETTELFQKFLHDTKIRKRELDSLIGKFCFATSVVPGRALLRRLYNKASVTRVPFHFIKISRSMRSDMSTWLQFLSDYNGISFFRRSKLVYSDEINMSSDASLLGFGATYGTQWIQASWPKSWKRFHITVLEFFPIFVLISVFARLLTNSNILFHCDNQAVVDIIKNKRVRIRLL